MEEEIKIRKYLEGNLSPEERAAFVLRMQMDSALETQVAHSRRIKKLTNRETDDFSQKVRGVIRKKRRSHTKRLLWIAASVAVLGIFFTALWWVQPTPLPELASRYLTPFPDVVAIRGEHDEPINLTAYNQGRYEAAAALLAQQYNEYKSPLVGLYLGIAYMMAGQADKALPVLEASYEQPSTFVNDLGWYYGLALIKLNQNSKAKKVLQKLVAKKSAYAEKASHLIETIAEL